MISPSRDLSTVLTQARVAEQAGDWDEALSIYRTALDQCRALGGAPVAGLLRKIGLVSFYPVANVFIGNGLVFFGV